MCHVCAILVGIAGTLVMAAPPMVAAVWVFPPREGTTATGVLPLLLVCLPTCVDLCVGIEWSPVKLVLLYFNLFHYILNQPLSGHN